MFLICRVWKMGGKFASYAIVALHLNTKLNLNMFNCILINSDFFLRSLAKYKRTVCPSDTTSRYPSSVTRRTPAQKRGEEGRARSTPELSQQKKFAIPQFFWPSRGKQKIRGNKEIASSPSPVVTGNVDDPGDKDTPKIDFLQSTVKSGMGPEGHCPRYCEPSRMRITFLRNRVEKSNANM